MHIVLHMLELLVKFCVIGFSWNECSMAMIGRLISSSDNDGSGDFRQ